MLIYPCAQFSTVRKAISQRRQEHQRKQEEAAKRRQELDARMV